MTTVQKLNKRLQDRPEAKREAMAAVLLEEMEAQSQPNYKPFPVKKRVAGLGKGTIEMASDFDDPLPDSFWLDEE